MSLYTVIHVQTHHNLWELLYKSKLQNFGPKYFLWRFTNQYQNLTDDKYSPIKYLLASAQLFIQFLLDPASFFLWIFQMILTK